MGLKPPASRSLDLRPRRNGGAARGILAEQAFQRMLALQHKRGQRSRQSFLLMLLKLKAHLPVETGVLFMEINLDRESAIPRTMLMRVRNVLRNDLSPQQFEELGITLQLLPEASGAEIPALATHGIVIPETSVSGIAVQSTVNRQWNASQRTND